MYKIRTFKTKEQLCNFIEYWEHCTNLSGEHTHSISYTKIPLNNGYSIEYRIIPII